MSEIQVYIQVLEILFCQFGGQLEFQVSVQMVVDGFFYLLEYCELIVEVVEVGQIYCVVFVFGEDQFENLLLGVLVMVQVIVQCLGLDSVVMLLVSVLCYVFDGCFQVLVYCFDDVDFDCGMLVSCSVMIEFVGGIRFYMLDGFELGVIIVVLGVVMLVDGMWVGCFIGLFNDNGFMFEVL